MKSKLFTALAILALLLTVPFMSSSCGSNPAAPSVAPPVELPTPVTLKFVEYPQIAIDVSTVTTLAAPSTSVYQAVGPSGDFTDDITYAALIEQLGQYLADVMQGLSSLDIPREVTRTNFEGTFTRSDIFAPEERTVAAKVDFSDFDLDGDGVTEGCSGNTADLPVCARVWLDGERYLAWVFETFPEGTIPGKSRFRIRFDVEVFGIVNQITVAMDFDERDLENKSIDARSGRVDVASDPTAIEDMQRIQVAQTGPDATALKRLNIVEWSGPTDQFFYLAQFKEGEDYWSGSRFRDGDPENYTAQCVYLPTANLAPDQTVCEDLGISVAGIPFADAPVFDDVRLFDFPTSPTF